MLSKAKIFCSIPQLQGRWFLISYGQNYGVITILPSSVCTVSQPLEREESSRPIESSELPESPVLPDWVKLSVKDTCISKPEDDDFVPPSVLHWIENHKIHDQDANIKNIVNNIVESDIDKISKILKNRFTSPDSVMKALDGCGIDVSSALVEQVLKRFSYEWILAFGFFKWAESHGITHSPNLCNLMVDNLGKMKKFNIMWELIEKMNKLEGYVTLDTITKVMRRFSRAHKYDDAIEAFKNIGNFGINKDITSLNRLMDALVKHGSVEHAEQVFLEFKNVIPPSLVTYNLLVHGWCKTRQIDKAKKTVEEMKVHGFSPDSVTYTCFIESYSREKDFRKVDTTLKEMRKNDFLPSVVTYTIILKGLSSAKEINKAIEIYEKMKEENCLIDASFYTVFINVLSKAGQLKDSAAVFSDMSKQGISPNSFTYSVMIKLATENLQEENALKMLLKMEQDGIKPDLNSYAPLLKMCCKLNRMKILSFLLSHMFKNDVSIDLGTYALLITGLCKKGKLERACGFFEESVMKGFVPMEYTFKNLVGELQKKGMIKEKERVEELMLYAKQQGFVNPFMKIADIEEVI